MKNLKPKHQEKLQKYAESINTQIQEIQSKKLYEYMILYMPFVDDYNIEYTSNTNRLSEANDLGDILLAGMQDLVSIVAEDALGRKDYIMIDKEDEGIAIFNEILEEIPLFVSFDALAPIAKSMQKLEKKGKQDSLYYKKLQTLQQSIERSTQAVNLGHGVQSHLRTLEWKFIKINIAIGLIAVEEFPAYDDVQRLEREAREICDKLVESTKEYDTLRAKLTLVEV